MTREELESMIAEVQHRQSELNDVEVKSARAGTPKRLYEALSAFANRRDGGVILFGLDENTDFAVVGVKDAHRLQSDIGDLSSSEMEPALRPEFAVGDIGGKTVVAVEIAEIPTVQRPCYYRPAGLQKGAYIRVGNTNRQMTDYEVFGYASARAQPTFDEEPVAEPTTDDVDQDRLAAYLDQLRRTRPKAGFLRGPRDKAIAVAGVLSDEERKILDYTRQHGGITNAECRTLLTVEDHRAYYLLKRLVGSGLLSPQGSGKGRRYTLP